MTYVIAKTRSNGRSWAKTHLFPEEPHKILHTPNQIRGHAFMPRDCLYVVTNDKEIMQTLLPALCGCNIFFQDDWV